MNLSKDLLTLPLALVRLLMLCPTREWVDTSEGSWFVAALHPRQNYEEACAAESRADFVHKLSICLKELRESRSWIRLIIKTEMLPEHRMGELLDECNQLCNIVARSIVTAKENKGKKAVSVGSS